MAKLTFRQKNNEDSCPLTSTLAQSKNHGESQSPNLALCVQEAPTEAFLNELSQFTKLTHAVVFSCPNEGKASITEAFPSKELVLGQIWLKLLNKADPERSLCFPVESHELSYYDEQPENYLTIVPCTAQGQFVALYCDHLRKQDVPHFLQQLEAFIRSRQVPQLIKQIQTDQENIASLSFAAKLHSSLLSVEHFADSGNVICRKIASFYDADEVYFGIRKRQHKLKVLSSNFSRELNSESADVAQIVDLMEEAVDQDLEITYPCPGNTPGICQQHRLFHRQREACAVLSSPVRNEEGELIGCLSIIRKKPFTLNEMAVLRHALNTVTPYLTELRYDSFTKILLLRTPLRLLKPLLSKSFVEFKLAMLCCLILLGCAAIFQTHETVDAPFSIKAHQSRSLTAPYDSFLSEIKLKKGDEVQKGVTVLARLETVELRLQKSELRLKRKVLDKKASEALRDGKAAEYHIALLESASVKFEEDRIDLYLADAAIKSDIDGTLLNSPFEEKSGSPIQKGQVLFELADLNTLYAQMTVADIDMHSVQVGLKGQLAAASEPERKLDFTVVKILPLAEESETGRIFRIELKLAQKASFIQPGVEGLAKIHLRQCSYLNLIYAKTKRFFQRQFWF